MKLPRDPRMQMAVAMQLHEAGIALMRQNLRRRFADVSEAEIDLKLQHWLTRQDDPIPGDVAGPVRIRKSVP